MRSTPLTRVRCQCDAVVLIKIVILLFFLFPFNFNYAVHTGECQCDAVVLIKIVILYCFSFPFILIMQSTPLTRVRCQCVVVLIKFSDFCIDLFFFHLF
jgi:uncharacterized membrane protein